MSLGEIGPIGATFGGRVFVAHVNNIAIHYLAKEENLIKNSLKALLTNHVSENPQPLCKIYRTSMKSTIFA
jgi:hypothetical protein